MGQSLPAATNESYEDLSTMAVMCDVLLAEYDGSFILMLSSQQLVAMKILHQHSIRRR